MQPPAAMNLHPLRLAPGADLRRALEDAAVLAGAGGCFVVCGIGSLVAARLRHADRDAETHVEGPLEILTLAGTLSPTGAHLHMTVADAEGRVVGGHVAYGNEVRTTAEVLLAGVPGWTLSREVDPATGFKELVVRPTTAPAPHG